MKLKLMSEVTPKTLEINLKLLLFITFLGFAGGCLAFFFISWCFNSFSKPSPPPSDAISIANTYIVYTTIIFTALAIFLALATYYFSVQQARSRRYLEEELLNVLVKQCKKDKKMGIKLITKLIENPSAVQRFEELHIEKIKEITEAYIEQHYPNIAKDGLSSSVNDELEKIKDKMKKNDDNLSGDLNQTQPIDDEVAQKIEPNPIDQGKIKKQLSILCNKIKKKKN